MRRGSCQEPSQARSIHGGLTKKGPRTQPGRRARLDKMRMWPYAVDADCFNSPAGNMDCQA